MPLSWNEIRHRAIAFSREWQGETREAAERQSFWNDFSRPQKTRPMPRLLRQPLSPKPRRARSEAA